MFKSLLKTTARHLEILDQGTKPLSTAREKFFSRKIKHPWENLKVWLVQSVFSVRDAGHMADRPCTAFRGHSSSLGLFPGALCSRGLCHSAPLCNAALLENKRWAGSRYSRPIVCAQQIQHFQEVQSCYGTPGCSTCEVGQVNKQRGLMACSLAWALEK